MHRAAMPLEGDRPASILRTTATPLQAEQEVLTIRTEGA